MKRQGDLLIFNVKQLPQGACKTESLVLAEGEATGHRHELDRGCVYVQNDQLFFYVSDEEPVTLNHPEHHPLVFPPGTYEVVRQREYLPGRWRYVDD